MVQKTKLSASPSSRPRGRPRHYDERQALAQATQAFWKAGFAATSLDDLTAATGMNRPSLYAAFGDKHALYLAALDGYVSQANAAMRQMLDPALPLVEGMRRLYAAALTLYLPEQGQARGCFLVSTAATESVRDAEIRDRLGAALEGFYDLLLQRLCLARSTGELGADADPQARARIGCAVLYSLALCSRAGACLASLQATAEAGVQAVTAGSKPSRR